MKKALLVLAIFTVVLFQFCNDAGPDEQEPPPPRDTLKLDSNNVDTP